MATTKADYESRLRVATMSEDMAASQAKHRPEVHADCAADVTWLNQAVTRFSDDSKKMGASLDAALEAMLLREHLVTDKKTFAARIRSLNREFRKQARKGFHFIP